jgi:hypothetical protein
MLPVFDHYLISTWPVFDQFGPVFGRFSHLLWQAFEQNLTRFDPF